MSLPTGIQGILLAYDTGILPPPFSHVFQLSLDWSKGDLDTKLDLHYTDREGLSEEELLDEGFSLHDDYRFAGKIDSSWTQALQGLLAETRWSNKPLEEGGIVLSFLPKQAKEDIKTLSNQEDWLLLAQEIIQAIYETSKKEAPLTLRYQKVEASQTRECVLTLYFATRSVRVTVQGVSQPWPWEEATRLMKLVFTPDYDYSKASTSPGKQPGAYLDCGDGYWFALGKGITNSHPSFDAVQKIKSTFDRFF